MRKIKYKKGRKIQPVTLEYTGYYKDTSTEVQLFTYDEKVVSEFQNIHVETIANTIQKSQYNWLNIHGLNNIDTIEQIGELFQLDNYILSDILNTTKRSKIEEWDEMIFFTIKSLLPEENSGSIKVEQISFILKDNLLLSFQEKRSDFFHHIRERLRTNTGIVRKKKTDFLLYLLLDAIMENFFITIENEENKLEEIINISKSQTNTQVLEKIEKHRDNFNFLKRSILPLRDSLFIITSMKDDVLFEGIEKENYTFFTRLYQKSLELLDQIEYDLISIESAFNFYFSTQNQKLNEVMKTLTVVSVFFIPLTFIVGIYGMNFDHMPELHWQYGYFYVLGGMFVLLIGMILYFKWKKWY